jgi:hypothetical protein
LSCQEHKSSRTQRTHDIADVDERPGAQQRCQSDASAGKGNDHQRIAGEQLAAADDHQN